jgi:hypothetical protein
MFQLAVRSHQDGNLKEAEILYKKILRKEPNNVDALLMLGSIYSHLGDFSVALKYINKALQLNPSNPFIYYNLANTYRRQGQLSEAIRYYQEALRLNPNFADAYYNLGIVFQDQEQYETAMVHYEKAIQLEPLMFDAYINIGNILFMKNDYEKAEFFYKKVLSINPSLVKAYNGLGNIYKERKRYDDALKYYKRSLEIEPESFEALKFLGMTLQESNQVDSALIYFHKALQIKPDDADIYCCIGDIYKDKEEYDRAIAYYKKALEYDNEMEDVYNELGLICLSKKQINEAIMYFEKALSINDNNQIAYNNLASAYNEIDEYDKAMLCCKRAVSIKPDDANLYLNFSVTSFLRGDYEDSAKYAMKAIELEPDKADAHFNLAMSFLVLGNFEEGWKEYEWRGRLKDSIWQVFTKPLWDGFDISDKILLICTEQGFGDAIQFVRYVPLIRKRNVKKIIVECREQLKSLLEYVDGIDEVVARNEKLPEFDVYCHLLSLPSIFNTREETIPANVPYIRISKWVVDKWSSKIMDKGMVKIGIAWAGSPTHKNDRNRSVLLDLFKPLGSLDNVVFYSLQKGYGSEQVKGLGEDLKIIDLTDGIEDFLDTAGLIMNLDLVISVDTAVAHLAGALGKPVWVLIPFVPDWRWMLNREDSPWYPTMRLFRQKCRGDWGSVIERIKDELKSFCVLKK